MNDPSDGPKKSALPFFIEFAKFCAAFAAIVAVGLFTLHIASASL